MTYSFKPITAVFTVVIALAACSSATPESSRSPAQPAASTPPPSPTPSAARLSVTALMDKAGCKGAVIGTQLYSFETGRCMLGDAEVTIAVFDTAQLRDEWVKAGRVLGGTIVAGGGWAAWVDKPGGADQLAAALGGARV